MAKETIDVVFNLFLVGLKQPNRDFVCARGGARDADNILFHFLYRDRLSL
jgi:hypothetical protein